MIRISKREPRLHDPDILVVGGGLGGVAAALAACRNGARVVLTEETDWLGGQLTAQGVPPDEHPWIEQFGCTRSYRRLRDAIRARYRDFYPLRPEARDLPVLNPGAALVSKLCAEPTVAARVVEDMLAPYVAGRRLTILREVVPVDAHVDNDHVRAITLEDRSGERTTIAASWIIDATELGDLLELTGTEHVTGFESRSETGEPSAPEQARPDNMQAISWCFAIDHVDGADLTIDRPDDWDVWAEYRPEYWPGNMIGLTAPDPQTLEPLEHDFEPNHPENDPLTVVADQSKDPGSHDLWRFRRLLARRMFRDGAFDSDIVLVNWPMIDYVEGPIIGVDDATRDRHLAGARAQSLAMLYWLQTEAPRPDGGTGWPGLRLRPDVMGTEDGFAKAPYVRESRRIRAVTTIREQDVSLAIRGDAGATRYHDAVGVGMYRIDLHPSTGGDNYIDVASSPYQLPLGALLPERVRNLLPASKNIGTTHITNGCYRLHPTEWNIGEVAGLLAAHCLATGTEPNQVRSDADALASFQSLCDREGIERDWPRVGGY